MRRRFRRNARFAVHNRREIVIHGAEADNIHDNGDDGHPRKPRAPAYKSALSFPDEPARRDHDDDGQQERSENRVDVPAQIVDISFHIGGAYAHVFKNRRQQVDQQLQHFLFLLIFRKYARKIESRHSKIIYTLVLNVKCLLSIKFHA